MPASNLATADVASYEKRSKGNDQEPIQPNSTSFSKHQTGKGHLHGTKIKTTQVKSQGDSSFPKDGHNSQGYPK